MALAVPLSRFTSRVGGGSAFYVRRLMRIALFISIALATSVFAFSLPGGGPNTEFIARVISVENLVNGKNGQEGCKARVEVEKVIDQWQDGGLSVSNIVSVYYKRSTNYVDMRGTEYWDMINAMQLHTNELYLISGRNHHNIRNEFGFSDETNGICVFAVKIVRK